MNLRGLWTGVVLASLTGISSSQAATYAFKYSSLFDLAGPIEASGTFTAGPGVAITSISGTVNGATISGATSSPFGIPTNGLLYTSSSQFLTDFTFGATDGLTYEIGNYYTALLGIPSSIAYGVSTQPNITFGSLSVSAVPLPAALPLYGAAVLILGIAGLARRKQMNGELRSQPSV